MSLIGEAETLMNPYYGWMKLAGIAALVLGIFAGGFATGRYTSAVTVANAKTETAQAQSARANDTALAAGAAAIGLNLSIGDAIAADVNTGKIEQPRVAAYDRAGTEASHAAPSGTCIDANPLRVLFVGMRDADAAATGAHRDGVSGAAVH